MQALAIGGPEETADQGARERGDAEIGGAEGGIAHQIIKRIAGRAHIAERKDGGVCFELVECKAGDGPAGDDAKADPNPADDIGGRAAEGGILEAVDHDSEDDDRHYQRAGRFGRHSEEIGDQNPEALVIPDVRGQRRENRDPQRAEKAADCHVGEDPHHDENHDRPQIAAAGAHEIAARAAPRKDHAKTKSQPADDIAAPSEITRAVHRHRGVDHAGPLDHPDAQHRGRCGQKPRPEAIIAAERQDVGQGSHGAEIGPRDQEPKHDTNQQAAPSDPGCGRLHSCHLPSLDHSSPCGPVSAG